jgi:hypothetical protein
MILLIDNYDGYQPLMRRAADHGTAGMQVKP